MAYLQRVWRFRPKEFHSTFMLSMDPATELRRLAIAAANQCESTEYLEMIRFDPSWLDGDTEAGELYALAMAPFLVPEDAYGGHILRLRDYLEFLGWPSLDQKRVLQGDKLSSLAEALPVSSLREQLVVHLDDWSLGGWLSAPAASELRTILLNSETAFRQPPSEYLRRGSANNADVVSGELNEIFERIIRTIGAIDADKGCALRIVSD